MRIFATRSCYLGLLLFGLAGTAPAQSVTAFEAARNQMVDEEIVAAGVKNPRVIEAMRDTPRHEFVPLDQRKNAYYDMALPIGEGQTISPPFVVAYMTEELDPQPDRQGAGNRHRQRLSGGRAGRAGARGLHHRDRRAVGPQGGEDAETAALRQRARQGGRRLQGLAGARPLRQDHRHLLAGKGAAGLGRSNCKEGGRMVVPVGERYQQTLYLLKKGDGQNGVREAAADAVRAHDRPGRGSGARSSPTRPVRPSTTAASSTSAGDPPLPAGWHYQRQLKLVAGNEAPRARTTSLFSNATPGRGCQALQGFAVDGRKVPQLELSACVRGKDIRPGQNPPPNAGHGHYLLRRERASIGEAGMGPWRGTFDWQAELKRIDVPSKAREAVMRIGLLGAVGELSLRRRRGQARAEESRD